MDHAAEGSLQEYLDGEMGSAAAAVLDHHLAVCAACVSELDALRSASNDFRHALGLLATPTVPILAARAAIASEQRAARRTGIPALVTSRGFVKAAMLLLMLGSAAAAAIPGSPLRRALESAVARVTQLFGGSDAQVASTPAPAAPAAVPGAPVTDHRASAFLPADGAMEVLLETGTSAVDVVVRMADDPRAQIATAAEVGDVAFRFASGRVQVSGLEKGVVTIDVPRSVRSATVLVDGTARVILQDGGLRSAGGETAAPVQELRFRIGS